jgi:hypothetical protein
MTAAPNASVEWLRWFDLRLRWAAVGDCSRLETVLASGKLDFG